MPAVFILKPAKPSFNSFEFPSYNEAIAFARKSESLKPCKPYKKVAGVPSPVWVVSILNPRHIKAKPDYVRFPTIPGFTGMAPACSH